MADKETIRPIYSELQGCLNQAPKPEKEYSITDDEQTWNYYHSIIDELSKLTGKDYKRFRVIPKMGNVRLSVNIGTYRQKLGGLIAHLYGEYFKDEPAPFADMPSTIIQQTQSQSVQIEFLLEVNNLINDKLQKVKEDSKEKTFLEKVRGSLSTVKNVSQLIPLMIKIASDMGLSINELRDLFNQ